MLNNSRTRISGTLRFLESLVPALLLFILVVSVVSLITEQIASGWGVLLGFLAGICFGFGALLLYWNAVDWVNLRIIRKAMFESGSVLLDGQVAAFSGTVRVDGTPLESPFTKEACAGYAYVISISAPKRGASGKSRSVLAQGFHLLPTRIEGPRFSLRLGALPFLEDELRRSERGHWDELAQEKLGSLLGSVPAAGEMDRQAALLEARHRVDGALHVDFCQITELGDGSTFNVEEEILPADREVCVVGTFDLAQNAIIASKPRFGPNLMVYRGSMKEVLERVGGDIGFHTKIAAGLIGFALAAVGYAFIAG